MSLDKSIWDNVWKNHTKIERWDYLSQVILDVLLEEIGLVKGKKIIEVGSGSGRISKELSIRGANVTLLDFSEEAIFASKKSFIKDNISGKFINGSLFSMPFKEGVFDVVWNAGVLEHYVGKEQIDALEKMAKICKENGLIITLNPFAGSFLHNLGKFIIERLVEYPFGREIPISSLANTCPTSIRLAKAEYSIGFIVLWVGMFKRLTLLPGGNIFDVPLSFLNTVFIELSRAGFGNYLRFIDKLLSKIFGGYLLVSIFRKEQK